MTRMLDGVAHISFRGGGLFLPFRSPYDRQTLIEHIVERVRSKGRVQVLIGRRRWLVHRCAVSASPCSCCGCPLATACAASQAKTRAPRCVWCAFGAHTDAA